MKSVSRHFSQASEVYHQEASLQRDLASELCRRISVEEKPKRVLDVGCGTGFLTSEVIKRFPGVPVDAIDVAGSMLAKAASYCSSDSPIDWIKGDARNYAFDKRYELIVSSSAIQWMLPLKEFFGEIHSILLPEGAFVFSCMLGGTLRELHSLRREIAPQKIPRAELPEFEDICALLGQGGFTLKGMSEETYTRQYKSAEHFFQRIKAQGFTGGELSNSDVLLSRGELQKLLEAYDLQHSSPRGGVCATYQVGFFDARRV